MSKYSEYLKSLKENEKTRFFGEVNNITNKYFTFNHIIDQDTIIIITNNVKVIKDNYVLLVDNNKGVYLKDWQVKEVHNYYNEFNGYAVKLNKNYFKPYTFNFEFEDMLFDKADDFENLKEIAFSQNSTEIALGNM